MRLISRTSVVLVVLHLPALERLAVSIYEQIRAALGAFLVSTAAVCSPYTLGLTEAEAEGLKKECVFHYWLPA